MPLRILLPGTLNIESMHIPIEGAINNGVPRCDHIKLNFARVNFVEPVGVVILSNLIEWLRKRGVKVDFEEANLTRNGVRYLDDTGFFEAYWMAPLSKFAHLRSTTFPFRALQCRDSHEWVDGKVFPWLEGELNAKSGSLYDFKTCIREVFNNIADHSEENVGCMHVQHFPNINRIKIAISDFGIGIPTEIRRVAPELTDPATILRATKEGFSSKGGKNRGAGLSYLVDIIIKNNNGWLGIYSGKGAVNFSHVTQVANVRLLKSNYPGTLLNMILRTDKLPDAEGDDDVELIW